MRQKIVSYSILATMAFLVLNAFSVFDRKTNSYQSYSDTLTPLYIPVNALEYQAQEKMTRSGVVSFSTSLDNDFYRTDTIDRYAFLYVDTKVDEFINDNSVRVPLNLSIVIDRSGSMSGEKMESAKKAGGYLVDQLTADDYVSIVMYDNFVKVLQPATKVSNKAALKALINDIVPGGSTNLWGGTEKGYEQVKANYKANYVNRVLLLSDGLANVGITDKNSIGLKVQQYKDREGITLSTFGIGLDYNETLMTDMAETGAGNYYFIEAADKLAGIFNKELNGLLNVAAQNTVLKVKLPTGVSIVKAYSLKYNTNGNELQFSFRDLFSMENKGVLLYCRLDNNVSGDLKFISTLSFDNTADKQHKEITNENILKPMPSMNLYVRHFNEKVLQQAVLSQANENMELAMAETDKGNFEQARSLNTANASFIKSNGKLVAASPELQRMDSVNSKYTLQLMDAEKMDDVNRKRMQKASKESNYKIRLKKQ